MESRLRPLGSHPPGLVYQFVLHDDGSTSFPFVSEGCQTLLDVGAAQLQSEPELFLTLIDEQDRDSYRSSMLVSARELTNWNWEGRVWIASWQDTKWINLRATPQRRPGGVQWDGLMTNITRSKLAEQEILRSRRQLAELSAHIERVKEEERARIAREIHDDLGGNLMAMKMALAQLVRSLPSEARLAERAGYLDSLVDRSIEAVHRLAADLRPTVLDLGIVAAIGWQAKEFQRQADIPCFVVATQEEMEIPGEQATVLFRVFQEALTNVAKHAQASMVTVHLSAGSNFAQLEVSDNGRGLTSTDRLKPKSFGLRGMNERVTAMGGELWVGPGIAGGCLVRARLPL